MKNSIKILFGAALASTMLLSSCIKETFPMESAATAEQIGASESGLAAMVSSLNAQMTVYNTCGNDGHWDFGYPAILIMRDISCNDMATYTSSYHHYASYETNLNMGPDYVASRFYWTFYYKLAYLANSILAIQQEGESAGIARAYRALAYLDMVRMYDFKANNYTSSANVDLAVPIVTEATTESDAANNPRASVADVYAMVEADLLAAEKDLASYKRSATNTPDVTVVWGLLARMYLDKGARFNSTADYQKAAEYARKAISKGGYTPMSKDQWLDPINGFNNSTSNKAWMWSVNLTKEDRTVTTGICNFISKMSSEATYGYALANGKDSPQKCIDKAFYESIPATDFRKQAFLAPDYSNASSAILGAEWAKENLDPYVQLKIRPADGNTSEYLIGSAADIPLMRIEEMYLIEAEATALAGGNGQALLESFVKTYRDSAYKYDSSVSLSENVLWQKRLEFWGEGIVWFDYKRLNKGLERGYPGTNHYDATRFNTDGIAPWFNVCINYNETNSNSGITKESNNPDPTGKVELWEE